MESLRSLIRWFVLSAWVGPGVGCSALQGWRSAHTPVPSITAPTPPTAPIQPVGSFSPNQGGDSTADLGSMTRRALSLGSWSGVGHFLGKEKSRPVAEIATAWRNKIEYLPNPAANGAMQPGLAGQVFLYTADAKPAQAQGSLIIDLIDETPRPPGIPPITPERWEFKKDVLKNLRTLDERFGECYVVFLPWPTYRPDVTHIRLRVRYEPEGGGFPIYAPETRLILGASGGTITDTSAAPPPPSAEFPAGPGMGVFRWGGTSPASSSQVHSTSAHPALQRWRVHDITPPVHHPASPTPASSTTFPSPTMSPSTTISSSPATSATATMPPSPVTSPSSTLGTVPAAPNLDTSTPLPQSFPPPQSTNPSATPSTSAASHSLPPPPLVPGPLPE